MNTFLAALAGGAIGVLLSWLARTTSIGREIRANDRALRILDRHLETWVSDATIDLVRELDGIRNDLAARNILYSSSYGYLLGLAKEGALHRYRDQERTAQSQADDIRARETWLHGLVRAWRFRSLDVELRAPERVLPVLDRWAEPTAPVAASDEPRPLDSDPRRRTIESTLARLDREPKVLV